MILPDTLSRTSWSCSALGETRASLLFWFAPLDRNSGFSPFQMCSAYQAGSIVIGS